MNAETLIDRLAGSSLFEAAGAFELLQSGAELVVHDKPIDVAASGIVETYRIRGNHISDRAGEHAKRLAKTTIEFVRMIESRNPRDLKTARVVSPDLGYFLIWFEPVSEELIGCSYLIKNNEITGQAWSRMWDNT